MSTRRLLLVAGILILLGAGAFFLFKKGYFATDAEDTQEIAKLTEKKLDIAPVATGDWPQWRGPARDGRAPAGAFRTDWDKAPPKVLWQADVGGGYSSCAVVADRVYTQYRKDGRDFLICLDAGSGVVKWEVGDTANYDGTDRSYAIGPRATPSVEGKFIWTVDGAGNLRCFKSREPEATGADAVWHVDLLKEFDAKIPQWGIACSPLIEGDLVIAQAGGKNGSVVAFDKMTGAVRWKAGSNPPGYSSPAAATVGGQRVVFALSGDAFLVIRASDGKVMDSYEWKTPNRGNIATPLVVDDYVFISSAYQQGSALLRAEAKGDEVKLHQVYSRRGRGFQNHHSSSVFKDRYLFGFDGMMNSARLKCVNFDTGKEKEDWEAGGIGSGSGSIILAGNHLIIQTERGDLCLVEATPDEFRLVKRVPKVLSGNNNWATPTLVDGRLYLRDETKVVCYDVRPQ